MRPILGALVCLLVIVTPVHAGDGIASTYAGTAGFIGIPHLALAGGLGGRYTGHINGYVKVCADRCATLPSVDYCECYWGTPQQRLVDLSPEAWALVSDQPRSVGLIPVSITLEYRSASTRSTATLPDTAYVP